MQSRGLRSVVVSLSAGFHVWALLRLYRRFVYDEPEGRVFGVADDVYISACFGRSLAAGDGFLWYPGAPRVEGISNPAWSAWIGALHWLPGFSEARLGAFIVASNALLLVLTWWLFWSALARGAAACARTGPGTGAKAEGTAAWLAALVLTPWCVAVAYWSAEGFEVALLAALALGMLRAAFAAPAPRTGVLLGALLAAGIATRMDFVWLALPALAVYLQGACREPRRLLHSVGPLALTAAGLVSALLLARHAYYGAWLPNTYWLKATHWPLSPRLARGLEQNRGIISVVLLPWLSLLVPPLRRHIVSRAPHALGAWLAAAVTVAYSSYVGGDSWNTFAGYDRHTAVGGLLLIWGLAALVASLRGARALLVAAVSLAIVAWPVLQRDPARVLDGLWSSEGPLRNLERDWIRYGRVFERVSRPGARIAVCPAGAIVYFSHRGGVDLLGKVDPYVANLPVPARRPKHNTCWRNAPGHNKEDDPGMFELRKPEFSRYRPPPQAADQYEKLKHEGMVFYVRRDSPDAIAPR